MFRHSKKIRFRTSKKGFAFWHAHLENSGYGAVGFFTACKKWIAAQNSGNQFLQACGISFMM